jgi:hypothetical protein
MSTWTHQYDVTDPSELGSEATEQDVAAYNAIQRRELATAYPSGPPEHEGIDDAHADPVADYIEDHWIDWLRESLVSNAASNAAALLGRQGGRANSPAQQTARAANARQGGRPRTGPAFRLRGPRAGCTGHVVHAPARLYVVVSGTRRLLWAATDREAAACVRAARQAGDAEAHRVVLASTELDEAYETWCEVTGSPIAARICREAE